MVEGPGGREALAMVGGAGLTAGHGRAASSKWKARERAHEAGWGRTAKRSSGGSLKALIRAP